MLSSSNNSGLLKVRAGSGHSVLASVIKQVLWVLQCVFKTLSKPLSLILSDRLAIGANERRASELNQRRKSWLCGTLPQLQ